MEFVILMTFMLLVFSIAFVSIQKKTIDINNLQTDRQVNSLANVIRTEIRLANNVHTGYEKTFWIPDYINGDEYNLSLYNDEVIIEYRERVYLIFLNASNIHGTLQKGYNTISKNSSGIYLT